MFNQIHAKAKSMINRLYENNRAILPHKLTPNNLGVFLAGSISSNMRRVGFSSKIYRHMRLQMVGTNLIAGTDGEKMFVGTPVFSEDFWRNEMLIEPTIELVTAFVYGLAAHEAAHCYIRANHHGKISVSDDIKKQIEYIKSNTKFPKLFNEDFAYKITQIVEDFVVEDFVLRGTKEFKYAVPYLNIALNVTFSIPRLMKMMAQGKNVATVLSDLAYFLRNRDIAVSTLIHQLPEVQEMDTILNSVRVHGFRVRNKTSLELHDYILSKQQKDDEEKESEDKGEKENEQGQTGGNSQNNQDDNSKENQNNESSEGQEENTNGTKGQNKSGISQSKKSEIDNTLGTDVGSQESEESKNQTALETGVYDSGFSNEMSEKEIKAIAKEMNKSDVMQSLKEIEIQMTKWEDVIRGTENWNSHSRINNEAAETGTKSRHDKEPVFLPQFQEIIQAFRFMKSVRKKNAQYQQFGEIYGNSVDAILTGRIFEKNSAKGNKKKRGKFVIAVDVSGSTETYTSNNQNGFTGHLRLDLMSCAYSMYELLANAGYPVLVIAHTTSGGGGLIYNIASYEMPLIGETDYTTTQGNEERFANVFHNTNTNTNADGWVIRESAKVLLEHEMLGDSCVIMLSDGMPSSAPVGNAQDYLREAIVETRQEGISVWGFAAAKDVLQALKSYYGSDFVLDVSGEDMADQMIQFIENNTNAF